MSLKFNLIIDSLDNKDLPTYEEVIASDRQNQTSVDSAVTTVSVGTSTSALSDVTTSGETVNR